MNDSFFHHRRRLIEQSLVASLASSATGLSLAQSIAQSAGQASSSNGRQDFAQRAANKERILVVFELSGGNDGLNTVVPYGDDAYYRLRPKLGIPRDKLRRIDDRFGFHPAMAGFERLYKDGHMAVVHGCGYERPSFSHFQSMAWWQTATPNSGSASGWIGRLADSLYPVGTPTPVVNIDAAQSLAVAGNKHTPLVFEDPTALVRQGEASGQPLLTGIAQNQPSISEDLAFLRANARSATEGAQAIGEAIARYKTPVDYGIVPTQLPKVAALIAAKHSARIYYASYRNNAFDTHVQQADLHSRLLTYTSDAISAFFKDMQRLGRAQDCTMLVFSEFGRRPRENNNRGTDHGTAGPMFVIGPGVRGGLHGTPVDLGKLDDTDNLSHTVDFRQVYSSIIDQWMGGQAQMVLGKDFDGLKLYS
jgi:uncharacterized protein (DUF1501 family)